MNLSKRETLLFNFYALMIVGLGLYFFFFGFLHPQFVEVNSKIINVESALSKINAIVNSKDLVEKQFDIYREKLTPNVRTTSSTRVLKDIESKAQKSGLNVINVKPLTVKEEGLYGEFDFNLEVEGELKSLGKFLYDLDESSYLFKLKFTQINAQSLGEPLKFQLLLSASLAKD